MNRSLNVYIQTSATYGLIPIGYGEKCSRKVASWTFSIRGYLALVNFMSSLRADEPS